MLKIVFKIALIFFFILTLLLTSLSVNSYLMLFDEAGNYFDVESSTNYHQGGDIVYGVLAFMALVVAIIFYKLVRLKVVH
jgi:hypothetical protein